MIRFTPHRKATFTIGVVEIPVEVESVTYKAEVAPGIKVPVRTVETPADGSVREFELKPEAN